MAKLVEVSDAEIVAACEKLAASGEKITVRKVYAELGNRGGGARITDAVSKWKENQASAEPEMIEIPVPADLQAHTSAFLLKIWSEASKLASHANEGLQRELDELRSQTSERISDLEGLLADVDAEAKIVSEASERQIAGLIEDVRLAEEDASYLREENGKYMIQIAEHIEREQSMRKEIALLKQQADTAVGQVQDLKESAAEMKAKIGALEHDLAATRSQLHAKSEKLEGVQADLGNARADLAKERAEHQGTREKLGDRLERLSVDFDNAQTQVSELQAKLRVADLAHQVTKPEAAAKE